MGTKFCNFRGYDVIYKLCVIFDYLWEDSPQRRIDTILNIYNEIEYFRAMKQLICNIFQD
jgi:hypothetical protein